MSDCIDYESIYASCVVPRETESFVFPRILIFPETKGRKHQDSRENKTNLFPQGPVTSVLFYIFRLSLKKSFSKNMLLYSARGQQLRNCIQVGIGRDTFEFDQKHVTKNQAITALVLLSGSL